MGLHKYMPANIIYRPLRMLVISALGIAAWPLRCATYTPPRRIRLKARVDLGDQTAEFIPFKVISTAILTYFYLLLGINVCILVSVINTRFQPDAPRRCTILTSYTHQTAVGTARVAWFASCNEAKLCCA